MKPHFKRNWFWYLLIILLLAGNAYFYLGKQQALKKANEAEIAAQENFNKRLAETKVELEAVQIEKDVQFYASLLLDDIYNRRWTQAKRQMKHIVSHSNVLSIDYLQPDGDITVSTLPREGENGKNIFSEKMLTSEIKINREDATNGEMLSVPLHYKDMELGRVIIHYSNQTMNMSPQ